MDLVNMSMPVELSLIGTFRLTLQLRSESVIYCFQSVQAEVVHFHVQNAWDNS